MERSPCLLVAIDLKTLQRFCRVASGCGVCALARLTQLLLHMIAQQNIGRDKLDRDRCTTFADLAQAP